MPGARRWIREGSHSRRAVFLDRDGVLIEDSGYLSNADQVRFIPGAAEAVARLNEAGITVVVVTNQSGIGRGYYDWEDFELVQASVASGLAGHGARLDGVWACAYHEDGRGEYRVTDHAWRKPNAGMVEDAVKEMGLAAELCWMVGDKIGDVQAGLAAGLGGVVHVLTGYGTADAAAVRELSARDAGGRLFAQCADLAQAASVILKEKVIIRE